MDIHKANADRVAEELTDILLAMPSWSWDDYVARVLARGYTLVTRPDSKGGIKGYVVGKGRARFKASELGRGRKLMASKIEQTWQKLHAKAETRPVRPVGKTGARTVAPVVHVVAKPVTRPVTLSDKPVADYSAWREGTSRYELTQGSNDYRFYIPDDVMQVFNDEFDYRETVNHKELTDMAVALFVGLAAPDAVPTGGGGGGSDNDDDWRDRKDEDEIERARRCARAAAAHHGKKAKLGRKR